MKALNLFLVVFALSSPAYALREGNEGSGGGNGTKSTSQEVVREIDAAFGQRNRAGMDLQTVLADIQNGLSNSPVLAIQDPRAAPILRGIIQSKFVRSSGNDQTPDIYVYTELEKKLKGACIDHGKDRDASVKIVKTKYGEEAQMCISVERLTRYTGRELRPQIAALFVHELAHLAGYGEEDADYVQNYALKMLTQNCFIEIGNDDAVDGRSKGFIFYVILHPGRRLEVKYNRYFAPLHKDPGANDVSTTTTYLSQDDYKVEFAPGQPGKLSFLAMNHDGSYEQQALSWSNSRIAEWAPGRPYPGNPFVTEGFQGSLRMNRKDLPFDGRVYLRDCVR